MSLEIVNLIFFLVSLYLGVSGGVFGNCIGTGGWHHRGFCPFGGMILLYRPSLGRGHRILGLAFLIYML